MLTYPQAFNKVRIVSMISKVDYMSFIYILLFRNNFFMRNHRVCSLYIFSVML
jgi:hypothetical protein